MQNASTIIAALGGTSKVATALNLTPSTVSSWKFSKSGEIPDWRMPDVRRLAEQSGVDLAALANTPSQAA
jgi:hypothetical protein